MLEALEEADLIVIAPSNPYVSIGPILAVEEIRAALERRRVPCVAVSPLIGGRAVKGPADRMLARLAGGTTPGGGRRLLRGPDRRARDRRGRRAAPSCPGGVAAGRRADADGRRRRAPPPRPGRARRGGRARVRVAILGGTGSFGGALAGRLVALGEDEIVIGSRDAASARGDGGRARRPGSRARSNDEAVAGVDLAVLAVKADAALETARELGAARSARRRSSRSRATLVFAADGVRPDPDALSLAERIQAARRRARSSPGSTRSRRRNLDGAAPDEDALVCGDDAAAKELALALAAKLVAGRALDAGPLASARTLEGLTAVIVNLNRRYQAHAGISRHRASRARDLDPAGRGAARDRGRATTSAR